MKPIEALFFDLDATLLDGSGFQEAIRRTCSALAAHNPGLDCDRLLAANTEVWQAYWPEVEDKWTLGLFDGAHVSREAWRRTLRACSCEDEVLSALAVETFEQYGQEGHRLFDDVLEMFSLLGGHLPLAVITNGAADTQWAKLRTLGIEHRFGAIVISGEVGVAKPDPAIFRFALDRLGVDPASVWHVGDSLTSDVAGAKAAGLTAVWLNRSGVVRRDGSRNQTTRYALSQRSQPF